MIPGDEIKTQTQSYAMQPCKLYFSEPRIRGRAGTAAGVGREDETEIKQGKVGKTPAGEEKKCGGKGSVTTTTNSTMSSDVQSAQSLCRRGAPVRVEHGSEKERERERARAPRSMCCPFIGACVLPAYTSLLLPVHALLCAQVLSCRSLRRFFQSPGRGNNGNVETKPVLSKVIFHNYTQIWLSVQQVKRANISASIMIFLMKGISMRLLAF